MYPIWVIDETRLGRKSLIQASIQIGVGVRFFSASGDRGSVLFSERVSLGTPCILLFVQACLSVQCPCFICPMSVFYLSNDWDWVEPRKAFHILPRGQKSHFRAEAYTFHFERATPFLGKYIPVTPCYRRSHFQRHESRGNPFYGNMLVTQFLGGFSPAQGKIVHFC